MSVVRFDDVTFTYAGFDQPAISGITLSIGRGELVVVVGRSGCGKTTLTRCINGLAPHFFDGELSGSIHVADCEVGSVPSWELAREVGSVFQDPRSQFFTTSTTDEVAFACENLAFPPELIVDRVNTSFETLGIASLRDRSLFELSSGERQKIAVASALALGPKVLVLDEPFANLDFASMTSLAHTLGELKAAGHTIVVSEHRLQHLLPYADRIVLLDRGRIAREWTPAQVCALELDELDRLGLRAPTLGHLAEIERPQAPVTALSPTLEADGVRVRRGGSTILQDITLSLGAHGTGVVGITGENGAGKTTLVRTLCGLAKAQNGSVRIDGEALRRAQLTRETFIVMQDAEYQLFTESVEDELAFGNDDVDDLPSRIDRTLTRLGIAELRQRHPHSLSGGQRQRVTIASAIVAPSRIMFFDEPTSGLDGASMRDLSRLLVSLASEGNLVVVISHDLEFLVATCDRVVHVERGVITADLELGSDPVRELADLLDQ